ncbi:MAG: bifunctional [glutamate--ammonia ligase]-adenylyl-L-tyrosine phosphorylase/[glutamate--ammonia-ligase] adenylyltransferase [Proteobacteria bacterium]|nr:bifunctional [glutamate--ammonia ligase]-adenylyl-L-tyrosine phosphorylase/[glutamate--ammonia-ligase] adenylyltransferase [Pseudomonadota bacterium]
MAILTHPPEIPINVASIVDAHIDRLAVIDKELHGKTPDHSNLKSLRQVIAGSEFIARNLETTKYLLRDIKASVAPRQPGEITKTIGNLGKDTSTLMSELRQIRKIEITRLGWRDLMGLAPLNEVMLTLSELADASIDAALSCAHQKIREQYGEPIGEVSSEPVQLSVIGLGKLGGRELNMSSDVDLLFSFRESGYTDGSKSISNHEFFVKVGQHLIDLLQRPTDQGIVFRVDMRLRPNGNSGPLALSFDALDHYYLTHGRDWERYALIKARPVGGDMGAGQELIENIRPFIYRKYLDFGAIDAIRRMKSLIEQEQSKKSLTRNLKLGRGGIREIEFVVQSHQLIFGGRDKRLQTPSFYQALQLLPEVQTLSQDTCHQLKQAYEFLRSIEHRLQILDDQQTHSLPTEDVSRARIAFSSGFGSPEALELELVTVTENVHSVFQSVFNEATDGGSEKPDSGFEDLWRSAVTEQAEPEQIAQLGFQEPLQIKSLLEGIPRSRFYQAFSREGRERLDTLMPKILQQCLASEYPDTALTRSIFLIQSIGRRSAYLALLSENPLALSQLVRLVCASSEISQWIAKHPVILDELLDPIATFQVKDRLEITQELRTKMERAETDLEAGMEVLREFRQAYTLRVAAADIAGLIDTKTVALSLSALASALLDESLKLAEATLDTVERPSDIDLGIIAYGKLGSEELGYHSDLDIVFVFDESSESENTELSARRHYYRRLVQRLTHILTTRTSAGEVYEIDTRLRPSGNSGTVVTPLRVYAEYLKESAWTWEHQALVRAQLVVGHEHLQRQFRDIRRVILSQPRDNEKLHQDLCQMRQRMRDHHRSEHASIVDFDLKHDPGGLIDIEFLCQYMILKHASDHPELISFRANRRIITELQNIGLFTAGDASQLVGALDIYLAAENEIKLKRGESRVSNDRFASEREAVQGVWKKFLGA